MKILFITNGYKPNRWGGTETYTAGLAEEMQRTGHDVRVLCAGEWERGDTYWNGVSDDVQDSVQVRRIHMNWAKSPDPFRYLYDNPVVADYLTEYLHEVQPDLVQVTSCETLSASVLRVVKAANVPLVLSLTDFWFLCPRITLLHGDGHNCDGQTSPDECLDCMMRRNKTYRTLLRVVPTTFFGPVLDKVIQTPFFTRLRGFRGLAGNMAERKTTLQNALTLPDVLITASDFVRGVFVSNGVTSPILVRPYGHDLSWLKTHRGKSSSNGIRFGYIGQITAAKGLHLILYALSKLPPAAVDQLTLTVYGDLSHTPKYGRLIRDLSARLPNITFGGTYPHSESANVFSGIDVLLVPSLWSDFPLIIYEAFATGTPVIATKLGGMAEAVSHERNGLLFERGDVDDLARQIQRIMDEPALIQTFKKNMPRVKTIGEEAGDLIRLYQNLICLFLFILYGICLFRMV